MSEGKRELRVNCGFALLLNDREGMLDNYNSVKINSGAVIVSSAINAKLGAMGARINCGNLRVEDIKGEIIQLGKGAVIDGSAGFDGMFVIAKDDIIVTKEGLKNLEKVEKLISLGKVYYPESANSASLIKISGEKQAYPDDAHLIIGNLKSENLLPGSYGTKKHVWISGRLTALEKKDLERAKSAGLKISCNELFIYQGLNDEFGNMIICEKRTLVPDGYEVTGKMNGGELALHGPKIYVNGKFTMEEKDIPALEELQSIIVKGKASLPASAVKSFKGKGKADEYFIFEGRFVEINGFEQFSHSLLDASVKNSEKLTMHVNGSLVFDDDVTPEDVECIAALSYNGTVIVPGAVKNALASKVKSGNGFMGDAKMLENVTGHSLGSLIKNKIDDAVNPGDTSINLETYILA